MRTIKIVVSIFEAGSLPYTRLPGFGLLAVTSGIVLALMNKERDSREGV